MGIKFVGFKNYRNDGIVFIDVNKIVALASNTDGSTLIHTVDGEGFIVDLCVDDVKSAVLEVANGQ